MQKQIKISVSPLGRVKVEAEGFQGQGCDAATKAIEQALASGDGQHTREYKDEWYEVEEDGLEVSEHVKW